MSEDYAAPPPPASLYFSPTKHIGALCLFTPTHEAQEDKPWGRVNSVYASVFILMGEGAGAEFDNVGISNAQMASQLRRAMGTKVLARLAPQGRSVVIAAPSAQDIEVARRWESNNPGKVERAMKREVATPAQQAMAGGMPPPPPVTQPYEPPF